MYNLPETFCFKLVVNAILTLGQFHSDGIFVFYFTFRLDIF